MTNNSESLLDIQSDLIAQHDRRNRLRVGIGLAAGAVIVSVVAISTIFGGDTEPDKIATIEFETTTTDSTTTIVPETTIPAFETTTTQESTTTSSTTPTTTQAPTTVAPETTVETTPQVTATPEDEVAVAVTTIAANTTLVPETTVAPTTTETIPPIEYITPYGVTIDCGADTIQIVENLVYDHIWETCPDPITFEELNRLNFTITDKNCIPINYLVRLVETAEQQYVTDPCPVEAQPTQATNANNNNPSSQSTGLCSNMSGETFEVQVGDTLTQYIRDKGFNPYQTARNGAQLVSAVQVCYGGSNFTAGSDVWLPTSTGLGRLT